MDRTKIPEPDQVSTVSTADGLTLHVEQYRARLPPRCVVVGIHGFDSHTGRYRHVALSLAQAGAAVTTFDCRGHGRSGGARGHVMRYSDYLDDLDRVVAKARETDKELPLVLVAHSHGGTIALDWALSGRGPAAKLVLAAPLLEVAMKVPGWKRLLSRPTARLWPTLTMQNGIKAEDISRDPVVVEETRADPLIHHVASARWFAEVGAAQQRIRERAEKLDMATFFLVAGQDKIVNTAVTRAFAERAPGCRQMRQYDALYHEMFLEPEWPQVLADVRAFIVNPLAVKYRSPGVA